MKTKNIAKIGLVGLLGLFSGCGKIPEEHKSHQVTNYPVGKKEISIKYDNNHITQLLEGGVEMICYKTPDSLNITIWVDKEHMIQWINCYNAKGIGLSNLFAFFDKKESQIIKPAQDSVNKWIHYIDSTEAKKTDMIREDAYNERLELGRKILE